MPSAWYIGHMQPYMQVRLIGVALVAFFFLAYLQLQHAGPQNDRAIEQSTQRLSVDPKDSRAYKMRAEAYLRDGKTEQARSDLLAAVLYAPSDPDLYYDLATVEKDNPTAAAQYREKAQQLRMSGYNGGTTSRLADPGVMIVFGGFAVLLILMMFFMPQSNREAVYFGSSSPSGGIFPD